MNKKIGVILLFLVAAAVVSTNATEEYVNPCEEFNTAQTLNDLFYETPTTGRTTTTTPNTTEEEELSYYTSGFFIHGEDPGGGYDLSYAFTTPITPGKYITLPTQNFTIGSDRLGSPVCPVDVTEDGEYPWYCPTPLSINAGVISFTYVRNDIAPPISILEEYNKTGVDPYSNVTDKPSPGAWTGPGYILSPALSNPDIVQKTNNDIDNDNTDGSSTSSSSSSSFWENDRVGYSFTVGGGTWNRIDCGNGISVIELLLGDTVPFDGAGPIANPETEAIMQCSPRTDSWKKYASTPKGWDENNYCPNETFSDYNTYIDYNYDKVSTYLSSLTVTKEDCTEFFEKKASGEINFELLDFEKNKTEFNLYGQCRLFSSPHTVMCGVPPSKFDNIYIPAQKYENWPKERQDLAQKDPRAFSAGSREVSFKPWHGLGFQDFGQHLVFYANYGDEESIQNALDHANDFYERSRMNGATSIRIPVVVMNPDNLWLQNDDDDYNTTSSAQQQPPPFTCASSTNDNSNDVVSSSSSSTNKVLNIGNNIITAALLSSAYIVTSVH